MAKVAAVCVVRNAVDLVSWSCGYYLRVGCDRIDFVDDNSTDGTFELLQRFAARDSRIVVRRSSLDQFDHEKISHEQINAQIEQGFEIVLPFDIDEFWNVSADQLRTWFEGRADGLIFGDWVHILQDRRVVGNTAYSMLRARHRAPVFEGAHQKLVQSLKKPFVCHSLRKVAFKSLEKVKMSLGNHDMSQGPTDVVAQNVEIFHVPLRSADEIRRRGQNRDRIRVNQPTRESSWQADHFADAVENGLVEVVWAANSVASDGCLILGSQRFVTAPDNRLRTKLLLVLAYLVRRGLPLPRLS